jgi:hypothetical protein
MAAPSFDDLYDIGKAEMLLKRADLLLNEGDITDFVLAAAGAMGDKNIQHAAEELRKTFLDTSFGDDLTTLVDDSWGIQRQAASKATVTLAFTRTAGGLPAGTIPAGTTVATVEDESGERQEFVSDALISWALSESGTKTIGGTAVIAGVAGNVDADEISVIVDSLFDDNITVNNNALAAGGNEEETDPALRERARAFPSTLRRGTLAALEYGALQVTSVGVATATESATGLVSVYVTDEAGNSTAEMVSDVATELENWRAAGTVVSVYGGSVYTQNIDIMLTVKAGTDVAAITTDIEAAIEARMSKMEIGEVLYRSMIRTVTMNVRIDKIVEVTVNTPAADISPLAGQLMRAGTITVS